MFKTDPKCANLLRKGASVLALGGRLSDCGSSGRVGAERGVGGGDKCHHRSGREVSSPAYEAVPYFFAGIIRLSEVAPA